MNLYTSLIVDLYKNPLNKRPMPDTDIAGSGANVTCGDRVRIYAKTDAHGKISDCSFEGEGCAITIAAASLLTEEIKGKTPEEILQLGTLDVFKWLETELGPGRVKCGLLPLETLQEALKHRSPSLSQQRAGREQQVRRTAVSSRAHTEIQS